MQVFAFIAFTLFVAGYSWYKSRKTNDKTADGFYLGGRSLGAITIAGSLLLTNLSAEQVVGLNGQAYSEGILVMAWETLAAIAIIVTAIFLLPRYMKGGITTIPEYVEKRFDHQTKAILTILFLSGYAIILLPTVLYSGSKAFSTMFNLPEVLGMSKIATTWLLVWGIGLIGTLYAIFGGLKAVAVSDLINAIGLLIGGLLIPIFGLWAIGDDSIINGIEVLWREHPDKFDVHGSDSSSIPFATIFTGMMLVQLFYWGTNQAILQRVFAARSLAEGQKGMLLAGFIKFLIPVIVVLPGIIAYHYLGDGLADPDDAYPALVSKVLPAGLVGIFAAVLFGAVLSSFNSVLNSSATLFGNDLYQYFNNEASPVQGVRAGKRIGVIIAIVAMCIAPLITYAPDGLFAWLQEFNGFYSIPILTVIVIGFFTKRVPALAAKVGVISGSLLYLVSQFIIKPMFVKDALAQATANGVTDKAALKLVEAQAYPHFLHVMAVLFVLNVFIMLAIGYFKPRATAYEQEVREDLNVQPWRHAILAGVCIAILVIGSYLIF